MRTGRYGPYVTEVLPEGAEGKAENGVALRLDVPGVGVARGRAPAPHAAARRGAIDGEDVTAQNGRYGPYVKKGTESRSLETEEQLFTVTVDDAKALFAQPPRRRGRGRGAWPTARLGADPDTARQIVLTDGRFGPYVTDGETNASLRKGDTVDGVTLERAVELLAERRAKSA